MRPERVETRHEHQGHASRAGGWAVALCVGLTTIVLTAAVPELPAGSGHTVSRRPDRHRSPDRLPKGTVWVVNRDLGGSLTIFDATSGEVLHTLPAIGAGAHDICLAEHAGKAFVMAEAINAVKVVDLETLAVDAIPVTPAPHHCELSPDGQTVYVSLSAHTPAPGAPQLAVIHTDDLNVTYIMTSKSLSARAHGPSLSADGDTLFVAHDVGNELTSVDLESGDIDLSVSPILRAEEVVATRSGEIAYVSSRLDGEVKRIDVATGAITGAVRVGTEPESVMLTPSERLLAVSLRGQPATLGLVETKGLSLVSLVALAPAESCPALPTVPVAPSFGDLAVMSRNGHVVFATFDRGASCTGGVSVVDVRRGKVVATWPYPGPGRPHGIAYSRRTPRFPAQ